MDRKRFDRRGEAAAALSATRRGATVLAQNWRGGGGELDLVIEDDGTICFCEVKTRTSASRGTGLESITRAKQRKITAAALAFLAERNLAQRPCRFDVAVVVPTGETCSVSWVQGAFDAATDEELDA